MAAKERLQCKYGGKRRKIAVNLENLEKFQSNENRKCQRPREICGMLDIAIINVQEARQDHKLRDGSLYTKLQRKLAEPMLARYHRWVFETGATESVTFCPFVKSWNACSEMAFKLVQRFIRNPA